MENPPLMPAIGPADRFFTVCPDILCILDWDFHIVRQNQACANCLGYSPDQSLSWVDLVHKAEQPQIRAALANPQTLAAPLHCRFKTVRGYRWLSWWLSADGEQYLVTARDINDHVLTEERQRAKLLSLDDMLRLADGPLPLEQMTESLRQLAAAKIAIFSRFDESYQTFETAGLAGNPSLTLGLADLLCAGDLSERGNKQRSRQIARFLQNKPVVFQSFSDMNKAWMPADLLKAAEKKMKTGQVVQIGMVGRGQLLGGFTLLMPAGQRFIRTPYLDIFMQQWGQLLQCQEQGKKARQLHNDCEKIINSNGDALFLLEARLPGVYLYRKSNQVHCQQIGIPTRDLVGRTIQDIQGDEAAQPLIAACDRCLQTNQTICYESRITTPEGTRDWMTTLTPLRETGRPDFVVGSARDITKEKKRQERIEYLSYHDQLTGLYNRHYFEHSLQRLNTRRNLPLALVMADLNGLKLTNDAFGHAIGDLLLQQTAEIIRKACRADDIIARLGGDEFVLVLPRTGAAEAEQVIRRIAAAAAQVKVGTIQISLSIGFAIRERLEDQQQDVLKLAEDRMYRQKLTDSPVLRSMIISLIQSRLMENPYEARHARRVSEICVDIGKALQMDERAVSDLKKIGFMHDLGKIAIAGEILGKSDRLTEAEWREIYRHSEISYRILGSVSDLSELSEYALAHHERWDGGGYPRSIAGGDIPLAGRIVALADAYEAMTSPRPWRPAYPEEYVLKELRENAGQQFDPELVQVFLEKVLKVS